MKAERLLNAIENIDEEIICAAAPKEKYERRRFSMKRTVALVAAILLILTLTVPALAAINYKPAYDVLYMLFPSAAQKLKPVNMVCQDNGIEFKVISAYVENSEVIAYVSVRDLSGDRIDDTTELFDSYRISTPFDCSSSCANISYDAETKTATFLISITQMNNQDIIGDKITFSARELLSNKQEYNGALPDFDMSEISTAPETIIPSHIFGGGGASYNEFVENFRGLKPTGILCSPVDGVDITAMGYIDEMLHIQVKYEDVLKTDNHGYIYFQNDKGEELPCIASVTFSNDSEYRERYQEYIYDLSDVDLSEYEAYGYFVTSDTLITGNWSVTFPIESSGNSAS